MRGLFQQPQLEDVNESSNLKTSRRPRLERVEGQGVEIDQLNEQILKLVAGCRLISAEQIYKIFGGSKNTVQIRLLKLFHAGYLDRPPVQRLLQTQRGTTSLIYALGPHGATLLGLPAKNNREVGEGFIRHSLMVTNFFSTLFAACNQHHVSFDKWEREPETPKVWIPEARKYILQRPDAQFELEHEDRQHFFYLEAERGTVSRWRSNYKQSSFWKKILYYLQLQRLHKQKNLPHFRLLTITPYLPHLNYLRELCRQAGPEERVDCFWFTLEENVSLEEPSMVLYEPLWFVPSDTQGRSLL